MTKFMNMLKNFKNSIIYGSLTILASVLVFVLYDFKNIVGIIMIAIFTLDFIHSLCLEINNKQ